ncbi:hypothetical protein BC008_05330 [Mastigocoleus testarum BC008]|uniref:RAP domain-containing protein n=1 Tax=Mastigocoleus testarum BC008 TaxID=371196 RepID=A0A0V7ZZ52_9CYAN|nr:hypothetical protein BC008_05330 [Mastigocoleus testarum BC008]
MNQGVDEKIIEWKKKLTDDKKDNPLLNLSKTKKAKIEISKVKPSALFTTFAEDSSEGVAIEDLVNEQIDSDFIKLLEKLLSGATSTLSEKGFNSLFLVLGTLTWFDIQKSSKKQEQEEFVSPLLLIPIYLQKKGKNPPEYKLSPTGEEVTINFLVANKLRDEFDITLPDSEKIQDLGYERFIDEIRNAIAKKEDWKVEETACITLFESVKTAMIKDIEQHKELIANHSILQGLALKKPVENPNHIEIADTQLDTINPESIYQICDADSSQQVVIETAKAGLSFVVQGPPGTGKSQTIANIIAELIAQDKRVLLVAEKQTALEAVYKKFSSEKCKLEELCLNLHHKEGAISPKEFVTELSKTKGLLSQRNEESESQKTRRGIFFQELDKSRQIINDNTASLHQRYKPIDRSAFELFGEILKLEREKVPSLKFNINNLQDWSQEILLLKAKNLINDLGQFEAFFRGKQNTIWSDSPVKKWDSDVSGELSQNINNLREGVELAKKTAIRLRDLLKIEHPRTLLALNRIQPAVAHIIDVPCVPKGCPQGRNLDSLKQLYSQLKNEIDNLQKISSELNHKYIQEFLNWDLSRIRDLKREFREYKGFFRWFRIGYWQIRRRVCTLRKEKNRVNYNKLTADIEQALERQKILSKLRDRTHDYYRNFELFFDGGMPDLEAIENGLTWLEDLQKYQISSKAVAAIISSDEQIQELRNLLPDLEDSINLIQEGFEFLRKHFPQYRMTKANELERKVLDVIESFIQEAEKELSLFQQLLDCKQRVEELEAIGATDFLSKLRQSDIPPQHWFTVLQKGVYKNWLEYIDSNNSELRNFNQNRQEQRIEEFSQLDTQQYQEAIGRLKQLHARRWEKWSVKPEAREQIVLLEQQYKLKRGHQRIRQFIKNVPELVTTLKPFCLMSPLAVSQYVDPEAIKFDVVIFDEASQVCTEDAVPSIMRANQVIVVGDDKQLPPTSYFKNNSSSDNEELEIYESLLDESSTVLNKFTLKWHYRSKHESLIAFSNYKFYDSELLTFPNPVKDSSRGVHFYYVEDGMYARGTDRNNLREAEEVAQIALNHFRENQENPDLSLGIVTLNQEQANTIQEQINQLSSDNPQFEEFSQEDSGKFFIKPLDKVQGDQQEVIIFSFGYGFDEAKKITYNFGPLTQVGGRRRLNVAITRAKSKFILVSSIKSGDFQPSKNPETNLIKEYFAYVENGGGILEDKLNDNLSYSDFLFEEDVYQALTERGYKVKKWVGRSAYPIDLAIIDERQQETEAFLLAIVCDGTIYQKYPTARERNRLRQKILQDLGWNIYTIWSKEWFRDRENQISELVNHIENLRNQK